MGLIFFLAFQRFCWLPALAAGDSQSSEASLQPTPSHQHPCPPALRSEIHWRPCSDPPPWLTCRLDRTHLSHCSTLFRNVLEIQWGLRSRVRQLSAWQSVTKVSNDWKMIGSLRGRGMFHD